MLVITSVDPGGGSTIDTERINSQVSLSHGKAITSVDPGGIDDQHREVIVSTLR